MSIFLGKRKNILANQNISKIDTTKYLKKDGSDSMLANLDLGNYAIENLKTYPENNKNAASKKYVDDETAKLLDLDANRQMKGDLDMNDNSILGIYDISADNSVPSKKFVKDEDAKLNAKIVLNTNNITQNTNDISALDFTKSWPKYSHSGFFIYQNPVQGVYKIPYSIPAGSPEKYFWLSPDFNEKTTLTLVGINADSDSTLPTTNVLLSVEGIFYTKSGGFNSKVFLSGKNIKNYRMGSDNAYYFSHSSFTFKMKDFHSNWNSWAKFQLKIAAPWTGNETRLHFFVTYY